MHKRVTLRIKDTKSGWWKAGVGYGRIVRLSVGSTQLVARHYWTQDSGASKKLAYDYVDAVRAIYERQHAVPQ